MKRVSAKMDSSADDRLDDDTSKEDLPPPGWKRNRLLLVMRGVDEVISSHLFLAATESSPLAKYRRMLTMFEMSAHFAVWFGGLIFLMWFFSIDVAVRTFLFNVFLAIVLDAALAAAVKTSAQRFWPVARRVQYEPPCASRLSSTAFTTRAVLVTLVVARHTEQSLVVKAFAVAWCLGASVSRLLLGRQSLGAILVGVAVAYVEYTAVVVHLWCSERTASLVFRAVSGLEESARDPLIF